MAVPTEIAATMAVKLLRALIDVFARTIEPVRPRRLYPRRKGPRLHGYHMAYKPCS